MFNINDENFKKGLDKFEKIATKEAEKAVYAAAEQLRGDSMNMAPFDRGTAGGLVSTANTTKAKKVGGDIVCSVGYNKKYAVKLHEDMSLKINQKNTKAGQSRGQKYLEKPMKENLKNYFRIITDYLRKLT